MVSACCVFLRSGFIIFFSHWWVTSIWFTVYLYEIHTWHFENSTFDMKKKPGSRGREERAHVSHGGPRRASRGFPMAVQSRGGRFALGKRSHYRRPASEWAMLWQVSLLQPGFGHQFSLGPLVWEVRIELSPGLPIFPPALCSALILISPSKTLHVSFTMFFIFVIFFWLFSWRFLFLYLHYPPVLAYCLLFSLKLLTY